MNSMLSRAAIKPSTTGSYKTPIDRVILLALAVSLVFTVGACSDKDDAAVDGTQTAAQSSTPANQASEKIVPSLATASNSTTKDLPKLAFDSNPQTVWSSGDGIPGWIQIDLGQPTTISTIRLNVSQFPPGPTTHQISAGPTPDNLTSLGTLDGNTTDGQVLELKKSASNVRYVKIETVKSPSWVAWREIEIYK